jgi:hypothetical protein
MAMIIWRQWWRAQHDDDDADVDAANVNNFQNRDDDDDVIAVLEGIQKVGSFFFANARRESNTVINDAACPIFLLNDLSESNTVINDATTCSILFTRGGKCARTCNEYQSWWSSGAMQCCQW